MWFAHARILTRLLVGFSVVLAGVAVLSAVALMKVGNIAEIFVQTFEHPAAVSNVTTDLFRYVANARMDFFEIFTISDPARREKAITAYYQNMVDAEDLLPILHQQYLGPQEDIQHIERVLAQLKPLREEEIRQLKAGRHDEVTAPAYAEINTLNHALDKEIYDIVKFARNKAMQFRDHIFVSQRDAKWAIGGLAIGIFVLILIGIFVLILMSAWMTARWLGRPLGELRTVMLRLAEGRLETAVPFVNHRNEIGAMANSVQVFKENAQRLVDIHWIKSNLAHLSGRIQTEETVHDFAETTISELMPLLGGGHGVFYLRDPADDRFHLMASYGYLERKNVSNVFAQGEGLVGQCAREGKSILLTQVPEDYIRITSGLGEAAPLTILVSPVRSRDQVVAVVEVASFIPFSARQQALLEELIPVLALNLEILDRNLRTKELLIKTQIQAEALQVSAEELRIQSGSLEESNRLLAQKSEILEQQASVLRSSEEELQVQSEELEATNEELTERQREIEAARAESERRAIELEMASRYKSEFLANMSHELRTPLNSLLILAKDLADNEAGTLTPDQIESATVVYESGAHLLSLINDILDLSKVESGKMDVQVENVPTADLAATLERRYRGSAGDKGLILTIETAANAPDILVTDRRKFEQIANNLIGNAIKFTERGTVTIRFAGAADGGLTMAVTDTGIGIPPDKQETVFHAFTQGAGTTSRQYGGTGLGLTIARNLARLLKGDLTLDSRPGSGSTFTLTLPGIPALPGNVTTTMTTTAPVACPAPPLIVADDRDHIGSHDTVLLVVEDDKNFSHVLSVAAHRKGFKVVAANDGAQGLALARQINPAGIILDISLLEMDGWSVMDHLKRD
ncbi:MAG: GAF domain-containing protein, partial [Alphaproteobacteria bacterium]|nr:GAF domain-containing protein [Alphaproteobacteria bacterium]